MKRYIVSLLLAACACLSWTQSGRGYTAVIVNGESSSLHYVLDPPELTAFDPSASIFVNVVYDYFAEAPPASNGFTGFSELKAGESRRLSNLAEGKHLLVAFFTIAGEIAFPVRVIILQAGGGLEERTYTLYSRPALLMARAGRGRISAYEAQPLPPAAPAAAPPAAPAVPAEQDFFRFRIDNQYEDWEAIPASLSFPADLRPASFTREQYGSGFEVLPISRSRHWRKGGTALNEIKIVNNEQAVYLFVSSHSAISANLSIFLYFHSERNRRRPGATNDFTLELVPAHAEKPGLVVLWEKAQKPLLVGTLASGSFFLEARIDKKKLYSLSLAQPQITFFDLTTSIFDRQELAYEEFYLATVALSDLPTVQTLY